MAESRRRCTWTVGWDDDLAAQTAGEILARTVLAWQRAHPRWFRDGMVEQNGPGLEVGATFQARDQWAVHRRQVRFAAALAATLRLPRSALGEPLVVRLPPHTHRGSARFQDHRRDNGGDRVDHQESDSEVGESEPVGIGGV